MSDKENVDKRTEYREVLIRCTPDYAESLDEALKQDISAEFMIESCINKT